MLSRTSCMSITLLAATVVLTGCNGPTKYGKQMRVEANERMNIVAAQISYDQARQAFHSGVFDKALSEINNAIERYDKQAEYFVLQGRIHLESHNLEASIASFESAIELDEEMAEPHYFRGIVLQRWSKYDEALESYSTAFELDSDVYHLLAAAEMKMALGDLGGAEALVLEHQSHFEHNAALRQLLAQVALLQQDPEKAERLYGEARILNPEDPVLLEELARAQYEAESFADCLDSINQLDMLFDVDRADLQLLKARCLVAIERPVEARELYLKVSRAMPADVNVWIELGTVAWEVDDYRRVALSGAKACSIAPYRYEGYLLKALNERHKGATQRAIKLLETSVRYAENVALPYFLLGEVLEENGEPRRALVAYEAALEAEPDAPEAAAVAERVTRLRTTLSRAGSISRAGATP